MIVILGYGEWIKRLILKNDPSFSPALGGILGFFGLGVLAGALQLALPLNHSLTSSLALLGVWGFLFFIRKLRQNAIPAQSLWLLLFLLLACSIAANRVPLPYDSGLYHLQTQKWYKEFPIAIGLGNLHGRLVFNNLYHVIASALWLPFFELSLSYSINSVFTVLFLWELILWIQSTKKLAVCRLFASLIFLFFIFDAHTRAVIYSSLSSTGNDLPAMYLTLLIFLYALDHWGQKQSNHASTISALGLLSFPIKLSSIGNLLFVVLCLSTKPRNIRLLSFVFFVFVVWVVRGLLSSGCFAYPVANSCLEFIPWSVSFESAKYEALWIRAWAMKPFTHPDIVFADYSWVKPWFSELKNIGLTHRVYWFFIVGLGLLMFSRMKKGFSISKPSSEAIICYGIAFLGVLFWFFQAPDLRFGLGSILVLALLPMAYALQKLFPALVLHPRWTKLPWALTGYFLIHSLYILKEIPLKPGEFSSPWPNVAHSANPQQTKNWENILIHSPEKGDDRCWLLPIPCTPYVDPQITIKKISNHWPYFEGSRRRGYPQVKQNEL